MIKRQRGAVLVMVAILIVVLIGVAALALDVGRLLVLRTEMNNAVDAAALAAAAELNGRSDAQTRAKHAALSLLEHDSKFSKVREILGDTLTEGTDISFEFFCAIENDTAIATNLPNECTNGLIGEGADANKIAANEDDGVETHYVRVVLNPEVKQNADEPRYSIDLYFLPVLRTLGLDVPAEASTTAKALAGRSFTVCNYPPLMICNPYEGTSDKLVRGQQIKLYTGPGSPDSWDTGNFALLDPPSGAHGGAIDVGDYLAGNGLGCSDPYITTETGVKVNPVKRGFNTRFGIYEWKYKPQDYGPSQNVLDYPKDPDVEKGLKVGHGDWDRNKYWNDYHTGAMPAELSTSSTRYDFYKWEIANNNFPAMSSANQCEPLAENNKEIDMCDTYRIFRGQPDSAINLQGPQRRVITVPVIDCAAIGGINGKKDLWVSQEEQWKRFFITEHMFPPKDEAEIFAEYLGNAGVGDGTFHVEVKLYE